MFGLRDSDLKWMHKLFTQYPSLEEAYIFGSRAKGTYRNGSDVDIALKGKNLSNAEARQIKFILEEESPMPFFFDVVRIEGINDPIFKEKILNEKKSIYPTNDA